MLQPRHQALTSVVITTSALAATLILGCSSDSDSPTPTPTPEGQTAAPAPTPTKAVTICDSGSASAPANTPIPGVNGYSLVETVPSEALNEAAANKTELAVIPGRPDEALLAVQTGEICRISLSGSFAPETWGDLRDLINFDENEQGLVALAFSPNFLQNGEVFAYYTPPIPENKDDWVTTLARFRASVTDLDEASRETVIEIEDFDHRHHGGHIAFDHEGYLLLSLGDGGFAGDPKETAQDIGRLLGKVIRIDVSEKPYAIPPDNPFVGVRGAREEIFAVGFRNPWRMSVDRLTGDIWLGDVGEGSQEEIDHVVPGGNYGWDCWEGILPWEVNQTPPPEDDQCTGKTFVTPRAVYPRDQGIAVVGGYVYRGNEIPDLYGWFVYADYATGRIWALNTEDDSDPVLLNEGGTLISTFAETEDGELLVVSYTEGIYKLVSDASLTATAP